MLGLNNIAFIPKSWQIVHNVIPSHLNMQCISIIVRSFVLDIHRGVLYVDDLLSRELVSEVSARSKNQKEENKNNHRSSSVCPGIQFWTSDAQEMRHICVSMVNPIHTPPLLRLWRKSHRAPAQYITLINKLNTCSSALFSTPWKGKKGYCVCAHGRVVKLKIWSLVVTV